MIQRVTRASVTVDGQTVGAVGKGFLVLIGISGEDTRETADKMISKMLALRIFDDENGKTNLSLEAVNGELLLISQFTLYADCRKGYRPSFVQAAEPGEANRLYEYFTGLCRQEIGQVETGIFGAHMKVELLNDGPVSIELLAE